MCRVLCVRVESECGVCAESVCDVRFVFWCCGVLCSVVMCGVGAGAGVGAQCVVCVRGMCRVCVVCFVCVRGVCCVCPWCVLCVRCGVCCVWCGTLEKTRV